MSNPSRDNPRVYQIHIEGHLDPIWRTRFEQMTLSYEDNGTTALTGEIKDQAMLHGILRQVRDLGLTLIAIKQLEDDTPDSES